LLCEAGEADGSHQFIFHKETAAVPALFHGVPALAPGGGAEQAAVLIHSMNGVPVALTQDAFVGGTHDDALVVDDHHMIGLDIFQFFNYLFGQGLIKYHAALSPFDGFRHNYIIDSARTE